MTSIKSILKAKKTLTGEEAGKAMLKDFAYSNALVMNGTGEHRELFTMAEKAYIQDNIIDDVRETRAYNRYIHLISNIVDTSKSVAVNYLSALYSVSHLNISMIDIVHNSLTMNHTPYIMTEKQYKAVRERHLEESIKDENGEYLYFNIFTILGRAFRYYMNETKPDEPKYEHIYAVLRKYDEEPCKDEYLISQYNRVNHIGYYTRKDGTKITKAELYNELDAKLKPVSEKERNFIYNRIQFEQLAEELDDIEDTFTLDTETKPFTLFNTLQDAEDYYPNLYEDTKEGEKERQHFLDTYKELIEEVVKQIDADYFKGDIAKWLKNGGNLLDVVYRADDLLNKGFPHILIHNEMELMGWNEPYQKQVEKAGVAVLKCMGLNNHTESDTYKDGSIAFNLLNMLLGKAHDTKTEWISAVESGIYFVQGYNTALDLIADYTGVEDVRQLKKPLELEEIDGYNMAYYLALYQLDGEGRKKIKKYYRPIRTDYKIPEERINKSRKLLEGLEGFKDRLGNYEFMDTLTTFIPEEHL